MKAFIALSKAVRSQYIAKVPIIYAMCKGPVRNDLKRQIDRYLRFKSAVFTA